MASHDLDNQKRDGEAFFTKIKELENQVRQLRTLQPQGSDAVRIVRNVQSDVSSVVPVNGITTYTLQYVADIGQTKPVFCQPEVTLYEDVADGAHLITGLLYDHWRIWSRVDASLSTDTLVVHRITVQNKDTVDHTMIVRSAGRWIVSKT